jgi:ESCRT-II complex subunit VPS25
VASGAHLIHRQQPNPATQSIATEQWIHLIQSYARHRRLFVLRVEDAETTGNDWDEILRNERINRTSDVYLTYLVQLLKMLNLL